jgi:very-short-patch-repair endonuclease
VEGKFSYDATGMPERKTVIRARTLRRTLSLHEGLLWRHLRTRPADLKFRRQHPVGPYVLDFFCREAAVAIEVDGMAHEMGDNFERDRRRDEWLAGKGIRTLRIPAAEILGDFEGAVALILTVCAERAPPPRFARSPSPAKAGEE